VLAGKSIYADGCYASIMSAERAYDIDNAMDFYVTEAIMKAGKENGK
jgi:CMP-N-acetylneuraminic acid synthetase